MFNKEKETPILGASREENATGLQSAQVINNEECAHAGRPIIMNAEEFAAYVKQTQGENERSKRRLRPPHVEPKPAEDDVEMDNLEEGFEILRGHMKFDNLKIGVAYGNWCPIEVLNPEAFNCKTENGHITHCFKDHKTKLCIRYGETKYSCEYREVTIDIPASSLKECMMELISIDNIRTFLRALDTKYHLICIKDIEKFIQDAYVVSCDVTKDVHMDKSFAKQILDYTMNNRKNMWSTKFQPYRNGNFYIEKDVNSTCKDHFTMYAKYPKLYQMRKNGFLPEDMDIEKYCSTYRFELHLTSAAAVKQHLQINNNRLLDVLNSKAQPLLNVYNIYICFRKEPQQLVKTLKAYKQYLIAKDCGFDLQRIECKLRGMSKSWSTSRLDPFRIICSQRKGLKADTEELINKIKDTLTIEYTKKVKSQKRESLPIL